MTGLEIPVERLSPDVVSKIIEEYVLREGTDYGEREYTLEEKVAHVRVQLERGKVKVVFDSETETVSLENV